MRHHQHWPVWLAAFALLALLLGVGTALYRTAGPEPAREPAPAQEAQPQKPVLGS